MQTGTRGDRNERRQEREESMRSHRSLCYTLDEQRCKQQSTNKSRHHHKRRSPHPLGNQILTPRTLYLSQPTQCPNPIKSITIRPRRRRSGAETPQNHAEGNPSPVPWRPHRIEEQSHRAAAIGVQIVLRLQI
jgi:hypothetical protein